MGVLDPASRQDKIIEAAIDAILSIGVEGASLEQVGKKIGMKSSHIVYYFPNKEALLSAIIQKIGMTAQGCIIEALTRPEALKSAEASLKAYIHANFLWAQAYSKHARLMCFFYYQCTFKKSFMEMNTQIRANGLNRIQAIISGLPSVAPLDESIKRDLSEGIQSLILGALLEQVTTHAPKSVKGSEKSVMTCVARLLNLTTLG